MERSVRDSKAIISSLRLFQFETWARFSPVLKMAEILRWMNKRGFCMKDWWSNQSGDTWESVWGQFNACLWLLWCVHLIQNVFKIRLWPSTNGLILLHSFVCTSVCLSICHNLCTPAISRIGIYMLYRQSSLTPTIKGNRFKPETLFQHYSLQCSISTVPQPHHPTTHSKEAQLSMGARSQISFPFPFPLIYTPNGGHQLWETDKRVSSVSPLPLSVIATVPPDAHW